MLRELVEDKLVEINYVPTQDMLADGLTKPLRKQRHCELLDMVLPTASKSIEIQGRDNCPLTHRK